MIAIASGRDDDGITMLVDCDMALISVFGVLTPSINRLEQLYSCLLIKAEGRYSVCSVRYESSPLPIISIADAADVTGEALVVVVVVIAVREASKVGL